MEKSEKVLALASLVLVGFFIAVIFHYILGYYLKLDYPFSTCLFDPKIMFSDFTEMLPLIKNLAPYSSPNAWINYFPLAYLLLFPFTFIKSKLIAYSIYSAIFLCFWTYMNVKIFKCEKLTNLENFQNIFILTILSYPFLILIDRGNFDMVLFILMTIFIYLFKSKNYMKSAIILAITNAIKPFFLIFSLLFLVEKKYKEFFISLISMLMIVVFGFLLLKGDFFNQISIFITNLDLFQKRFLYDNSAGMSNSSNLFMALKLLIYNSNKPLQLPTFLFIRLYNFLSIIITFVTVLALWREKIFWKKISLLTFYMLLVPYVIFDYKLIFVFLPIWLFANTKEKSKFDLAYTILFALLLIPKRFIFIWMFGQTINWHPFSIIINPLIMLVFMGLIILNSHVE